MQLTAIVWCRGCPIKATNIQTRKNLNMKNEDSKIEQPCTIQNVSGCDSIKTNWDIRECFKQLRFDKNHHLGLGDIRLTIAQQEEICDLVERFYHCR